MSIEDQLYFLLKYYKKLPDSLRNGLIYPIRIIPRSFFQGKNYKKFVTLAHKFEFASRKSIEIFQTQKIIELVNFAYNNIKFYKDFCNLHDINVKDIQNLNDFHKNIPLIDKGIVQEKLELFIAPEYNKTQYLYANTGGSTGTPLKLLYLKGYTRTAERAFWDVIFRRVNYKQGIRVARLRGDFIGKNRIYSFDPYRNTLMLNTFLINEKNAGEYLRLMNKFKIEYLHAYPAALYNLIQNSKQNSIKIKSLKYILLNSENILDWQISLFESFFDTKNIFYGYGLGEMVAIAASCEHSRYYHFHPAYSYVEFHSSKIKDNSNINDIIGTSFLNPLMPLIRYRTGDLCELNDAECSCNRNHKIASRIIGRSQDVAIGKNNERITLTALIFGRHAEYFNHIKKMQIINTEPGKLIVIIVPKISFNTTYANEIINSLSAKEGMPFEAELDIVQEIELTERGKHKFFKRLF